MSDERIEIILVGDSKAGKTALIERYTKDEFSDDYKATIGADFLIKFFDKTDDFLQIWDLPGQERFRGLQYSFLRSTEAVLFCIDVTKTAEKNKERMLYWQQFVLTKIGEMPKKIYLVATKTDLADQRQTSHKELRELAKSVLKIPEENVDSHVFETSAKTGDGVQKMFQAVFDAAKAAREKEIERLAKIRADAGQGTSGSHKKVSQRLPRFKLRYLSYAVAGLIVTAGLITAAIFLALMLSGVLAPFAFVGLTGGLAIAASTLFIFQAACLLAGAVMLFSKPSIVTGLVKFLWGNTTNPKAWFFVMGMIVMATLLVCLSPVGPLPILFASGSAGSILLAIAFVATFVITYALFERAVALIATFAINQAQHKLSEQPLQSSYKFYAQQGLFQLAALVTEHSAKDVEAVLRTKVSNKTLSYHFLPPTRHAMSVDADDATAHSTISDPSSS